MLAADELAKQYANVRALDGFTLHVRAGEVVGLVGHNGAGKSTFVDVLSALVRPDGGRVTIGGKSPKAARGDVGVAPQRIALYPASTVAEHLRLYGKLAGLRRSALTAAIDEVVEVLRLSDFLHRRTGVLSGGQQRRAQAAIALLHRPGLLLLDEPTAGADPQTRQALLAAVRKCAADGAAVVYTTHYLPEISELQATIAVARRGRIIARGTSEELLGELPGEIRLRLAEREICVRTTDPARALIALLATIGEPVHGIELRNPSLDDLYRSLA